MSPFRRNLLVAAAFLGLGLLVYGQSLHNGFVIWDDDSLITENPIVKIFNVKTLWTAFTIYDPELYIPLTFLSFQFEHLLFGFQPFFYHLDNLLLHIINALLVYGLLARVGIRRSTALFLGAVFLVHPLNTEAVAWASARKDVLCTAFLLLSVVAFVRWRKNNREAVYDVTIAMAFLAMLAKALAVLLPVGYFAIDILHRHRWKRGDIVRYVPFLMLSFAFLFIGLAAKTGNITGITPWQTMLLAAKALATYPVMLLWPADLSIIYMQATPITITSAEFFVPLIVCIAVFLLAIWSLRRTTVVAAGLLWYVAFLAPSFANFVKVGTVYALSDRYPYVAQIGVLLIVGAAMDGLLRRFRVSVVPALAAACIVGVLGVAAHQRSLVWASSEGLFRNALLHNDASVVMHYNLGTLAYSRGETEEAEREFHRAIELDSSYADAHHGLAKILLDRGDSDGALAEMRLAVEGEPENAEALTGLAGLLLDRSAFDEAIPLLERAIVARPGYADAHAKLGYAYGKVERYEDGLRELREAQRLRDIQDR